MIEAAGHFTFGITGSARPYLREGWSLIETDYTWTDGARSVMSLPFSPRESDLVIEIGIDPMLVPPVLREQRLSVDVNGVRVCEESVAGACTLGAGGAKRRGGGMQHVGDRVALPGCGLARIAWG